MTTQTAPSNKSNDANLASLVRLLNDEIEKNLLFQHHHLKIIEIVEQCLALSPKAAAHIAQSRFPAYAARTSTPWPAKALGATLGFTDPRHPLLDSTEHHGNVGYDNSSLNDCAQLFIDKLQYLPALAFDDAELVCKLALCDSESPAGEAFHYACQNQPHFNPMRALEVIADSTGFGLFDNFRDTSQFARAFLEAPGWRPDSNLGLLQWLASALVHQPHSRNTELLFSTISTRAPDARLASLLMLPISWRPFDHESGSKSGTQISLFDRALSRARAGANPPDEQACATQAARHAALGMAEFLSKPARRGAPRPSIVDFCSGDARTWAFLAVEPDDIALLSPRDRLAWLDFSIASGRWRHAARAIDSHTAKNSALAQSPIAIARCLGDPFLAPVARDNQPLPFLRKAMRFSGRPAAFASELAEAPSERPIAPALIAKLFATGASVERTTLRSIARPKATEVPRLIKRL